MIDNHYVQSSAKALSQIAFEEKKEKLFLNQLFIIKNIFSYNPEVVEYLASGSIKLENKKKFIEEIFDLIEPLILNFLLMAVENNKIKYLDNIFLKAILTINKKLNIENGIIYTTLKLSDKKLLEIEKKLSVFLKKEVKLLNLIDKELISGYEIQVGDFKQRNNVASWIDQMALSIKKGD
ncbi:ATP synthase F1 subunit delta [Mycoplasmopsis pulmonis]|uniref:ATP synthase F1 subunit delta n=1 Tax=Mycoplasmopsis pulmonis TaxID=2107 RepID=UPI001004FB2F|nr:ATP synthase F1 subunit delta [Mycoplasmopsis pulmonis]VEU68030.1 F0F1 ATP synthase subunit delta [Mycoplasmopsis pulmonis]